MNEVMGCSSGFTSVEKKTEFLKKIFSFSNRSEVDAEATGLGFLCFVGVMGCGAAEATGLFFVCFVVFNARMLSANRVDFELFFFS